MSKTQQTEPRPSIRPCIEITPTADQYRQLCQDLKKLRRSGAGSNTDAILEAVHTAAVDGRIGS